MKQVIVQSYCDLCAATDKGDEPATDEVTHEGRLLDVCSTHAVVVGDAMKAIEELFALGIAVEPRVKVPMKRHGGRRGRPSIEVKESEEWRTCPDCGYTTPTRSALGTHCKNKHGTVLGDYTWST